MSDGGPVFHWIPCAEYNEFGARVFSRFDTSILFARLTREAKRRHPNHRNVYVFAELIWSDGTAVTIRMSSHPVVCSCANINDGLINTELNNIRLGVSAPDPRMKYVQKNKASVHAELKRFR